jgi:cytochrome c-type biogenesis protein CcmI
MSAKDRRRATELLRIGNDPNVNVYREQLAEMEADLRSGLMPREQFDRDREELDRRVLEDCRNTG